MSLGIVNGAMAGAAGTTALNAATYLDMAVRGRPTSDTPQQMVESMANSVGVPIPGEGDERANRLSGLGPLFGSGVGVGIGTVAGIVHRGLRSRGRSLPAPLAAVLIGAAAMAFTNLPLKLAGISDPTQWRAADWASDAVPHLAYGAATYATLRATDPG